jgi:hypothetical protein
MLYLVSLLAFGGLTTARAQPPDDCRRDFDDGCAVTWAVAGARLFADWAAAHSPLPPGFEPPPGAGEVQPNGIPPVCSITPSTGQMSGVNVRAAPNLQAPVIGDIPLDSYREVTAIGDAWYKTITRRGETGYVAAHVAALVGPCGDVPPLDVP